jgi:phosphonate transport system substrate-binding protein
VGVEQGVLANAPVGSGHPLRFASFLGDNALDFYRRVVGYLAETTGLPAELQAVSGEQDALFAEGALDGAFCCGLPYVWQSRAVVPRVRLLAAPVMPGERYAGRPVYFSDIIVHADSPFRRLEDLRGARFAYNQTASFSGYVHPCYHLLTLGEGLTFFGAAQVSGSHAASMEWVERGQADCAAIDSVVLEMELRQHAQRARSFRVVESIGPAPMPPVIAAATLPMDLTKRLTAALLQMHTTAAGQSILREAGVQGFAPVHDRDYDPIRHILRALAAQPAAG